MPESTSTLNLTSFLDEYKPNSDDIGYYTIDCEEDESFTMEDVDVDIFEYKLKLQLVSHPSLIWQVQ